MISSLGLLGKRRSGPAVTEIVPNRTLMVLPEAFLLGLIGPHDPAVQGLIELACPQGLCVLKREWKGDKKPLL
jgi:hypothetical protein